MHNIFHITHTFHITGRGFFVGGMIEDGTFHIDDEIQVLRNDSIISHAKIAAIEFLNFGQRQAGRKDNIVFRLKDFENAEILVGDYLQTL